MNPLRVRLFSVAVLAAMILISVAGASSPATAISRISGPYRHENLTIYLLHGPEQLAGAKVVTLGEAIRSRKLSVLETGRVNELAVENHSDVEVYIESGDMVKGGKQDRVLGVDLIVPPKSGRVPIAAFCVERGRWQARGGDAAGPVGFGGTTSTYPTSEGKLAIRLDKDQRKVWEQIDRTQVALTETITVSARNSESPTSMALTLENKEVDRRAQSFVKALSSIPQSDVVGCAMAINGKLTGAEMYSSRMLFRRMWPQLLKARAVEALAASKQTGSLPAVTAQQVRAFLQQAEAGRARTEPVTNRIEQVTRETDRAVFFESRDLQRGGRWIHRSYLAR